MPDSNLPDLLDFLLNHQRARDVLNVTAATSIVADVSTRH